MTRVSEGSATASLNYSITKAKQKMEDLQLKGSTLKSMSRPSDNPVSNVEAMQLTSIKKNNNQYIRNAEFANMHLNVTEKALENLTELMVKAKEVAIAQSSDLYNPDVRKNIANEVIQMRNMALSIANKRLGQRFIFGGYKTLEPPFDRNGDYKGDMGHMTLEVSKDFFVQTNLHGHEVFYTDDGFNTPTEHPLNKFPDMQGSPEHTDESKDIREAEALNSRELASLDKAKEDKFHTRENLFSLLETLSNALENNEPNVIRDLLPKFDSAISRLITMRTRVGSISTSVMSSINTLEADNINNAERRSKIVDADIAELFADISKQQEVLKTTYKSSQGLLNQNLLDFIR
jgi:flagellar hook-associated protein 3 FlgL